MRDETGRKIYVGDTYTFADVDWRVLDIEDGKALLISKNIIGVHRFYTEHVSITWQKCLLREFLNTKLYSKYGGVQSPIVETRNTNPDNPWFRTEGCDYTYDKIFLLSLDEVCRYFGDSTANLKKKGSTGSNECISDENNKFRIAKTNDGEALWWWLRSPGCRSRRAAFVHEDGSISMDGLHVDRVNCGVRPALWLKF